MNDIATVAKTTISNKATTSNDSGIIIHIETKKSWLKSTIFSDTSLLTRCVLESNSKLNQRPIIKVYGKIMHQNRNVGFFSDTSRGYTYSGQLALSKPLTINLKKLLNVVNQMYNTNFNGILVNQYMNGSDYIGAHSDDESGLGSAGVVAISIGAVRKFRIRNITTRKIEKDILLENGMMLQMGGDFQKEFTHEIPIEKKVKDIRYSFTFRYHIA